jgi:hypothetical protein
MVLMRGRSRFRHAVLCFALILCFTVTTFAYAEHGLRVVSNVQVNEDQLAFPDDYPGRSTASLASSADGQELLATWDDLQGFCGPPNNRACTPPDEPGLTGFGYSTDGGQTWIDGGAPPVIGETQSAGHGWVDRGGAPGNEVYYLATRNRVTETAASLGVGVYRGHFENGTFVWDNSHLILPAEVDFISRPSIAARKNNSGAVYVAVINAIELCNVPFAGFGQVEVYRSHDFGETWQGPVVVSPDAAENNDPEDPDCGNAGPFQIAPAATVGPRGEVYVAWVYGPRITAAGTGPTSQISFSRSLDGGRTFSPRKNVIQINTMFTNAPVGYGKNRMNDQPRIAVATGGPHRGRIYISFQEPVKPVAGTGGEQSVVSSQAYVTWSDDQGETWSTPQAIASPVPATRLKRFWPTVTVRPNGDVDVVYMESRERQVTPNPTDIECDVPIGGGLRRTGTRSSLVDTYMVQSRDGGESWSTPVRISKETSNWCTAAYIFPSAVYSNFGDYLGTVSLPNRTLATWPDSRNGWADIFFAEIVGTTPKND